MPEPSDLPRWATDALRTQNPDSSKKDVGFVAGEEPAPLHMNWLFNNLYEWMQYVQEIAAKVPDSIWHNIYSLITDSDVAAEGDTYQVSASDISIPITGSELQDGVTIRVNALYTYTINNNDPELLTLRARFSQSSGDEVVVMGSETQTKTSYYTSGMTGQIHQTYEIVVGAESGGSRSLKWLGTANHSKARTESTNSPTDPDGFMQESRYGSGSIYDGEDIALTFEAYVDSGQADMVLRHLTVDIAGLDL